MAPRTPAPKPNRPRRPDAPPKRERPRDELGRPLDWSAENRLHLEAYDAMPVEENHRLGVEHFNARRFFPAHEAWETCWKQAKQTGDAEFFKGLSQLGAGYVHHLRGNPHGAHTLLRRAASRLQRYGPEHLGVRAAALARAALEDARSVERAESEGRPAPELRYPKV